MGRNAPTGGKRKQPKQGTDCATMVNEWREQISKLTPSLWGKLQMFVCSKGKFNGLKRSGGRSVVIPGGKAEGECISVRGGVRPGSIRKIFGAIANRPA